MGCNVGKDVKVDEKRNNDASDRKESSMSEEQAAEKIQASFRGYKTRKILKDNGMTVTRSGSGTGNDAETKKEGSAPDPEEVVDIDLNDAELARAAAKIQASYRNFSAKKKELQESIQEEVKQQVDTQIEECLEDIDLEDPDVEKAALKIQSTFRGYKVRKEVEAK